MNFERPTAPISTTKTLAGEGHAPNVSDWVRRITLQEKESFRAQIGDAGHRTTIAQGHSWLHGRSVSLQKGKESQETIWTS